jgi:hypothetical protein
MRTIISGLVAAGALLGSLALSGCADVNDPGAAQEAYAVSSANNADDDADENSCPPQKVLMCHTGKQCQKEILVAIAAVPRHLSHGDYLGPCIAPASAHP